MWPPTGLIPWFSKTEGNTYATLLHHPFLFGEILASSRGSKKNFWRCCRGVCAKVNIPSTHHKPLSPALHYLPFASHFPLPHFTLAVLFALSFPFASFLFASCLLVCWIACLSRWLFLNLVIFTLKGWKRSKAMSGVLWSYSLSIIISLETSLRNKKAL